MLSDLGVLRQAMFHVFRREPPLQTSSQRKVIQEGLGQAQPAESDLHEAAAKANTPQAVHQMGPARLISQHLKRFPPTCLVVNLPEDVTTDKLEGTTCPEQLMLRIYIGRITHLKVE